jgi:outer membrane immunogenic protein
MRKLLLATVALGALSATPALAADMIRPAPRIVVAPPPVTFNWTGAYFGVQGGYGWNDGNYDGGSINMDAGFLGANLSGLWQTGSLVLGAEVEGNYSWASGGETFGLGFGSFDARMNAFGSIAAKVGFAMDRFLVFATGGLALANIDTVDDTGLLGSVFEDSNTYIGWTLGAGVDWAVTNNFVLGVQYRYYDFGTKTLSSGFDFGLTSSTVTAKAAMRF